MEELAARLQAVQLEKARLELQNNLLESALLACVKLSAQQDGLQMSTIAKVFPILCRPSNQLMGASCAVVHFLVDCSPLPLQATTMSVTNALYSWCPDFRWLTLACPLWGIGTIWPCHHWRAQLEVQC